LEERKTMAPRQLTLDDMARARSIRDGARVRMLKHIQAIDTPRMLLEAGCALLRLGIPAGLRRVVVGYVLDCDTRPVVYGAKILAGWWEQCAEATRARAEWLKIQTTHGVGRSFVTMDKTTRARAIVLIRQQIRAEETARDGVNPGPMVTHGGRHVILPHTLDDVRTVGALRGSVLVSRALEIHPRRPPLGASLMELYAIRRALHTQRPKVPLFLF
jgi:hypothetical protein